MVVGITRPVIKRCPFRGETDAGELTIVLSDDVPELHDLAEKIDALCAQPISHEDFTRAVRALLPDDVLVRSRWHTGPWTVEVTEGD